MIERIYEHQGAWANASSIAYRWTDESACFNCPCGTTEILLSESGATIRCDCGRVYRLFCRVEVDTNSVPAKETP